MRCIFYLAVMAGYLMQKRFAVHFNNFRKGMNFYG